MLLKMLAEKRGVVRIQIESYPHMRATHFIRVFAGLALLHASLQPLFAATVYEWTFDNNNLSATLGPGTMQYADSATAGLVSFSSTTIGSETAGYLHVPAFTDPKNGCLITLSSSGPNGGGAYINRYSIIFDVRLPGALNWTPFFNTNPLNENDADFYVASDGALGISSIYSSAGVISPNTWHRIAFVADLAAQTLTYYVDGTQVAQGTISGALDGRWSLYSNVDAGPDLFFFNEGDSGGIYTHETDMAALAIVDRSLSASEIAALGAPTAEGIFARRLQIRREGDMAILNWRAGSNVVLQKAGDLQNPIWETIDETLGASSFSEPFFGNSFYRLITQ